ncbi:MAG: tetratricopeptide repeat protein, partial [Gammaproteobacteria bacterium]
MSDTPLKPEIQNLIEKGFNALTKADFKTAGLCCQEILDQEPDLAEGHFLVGLVGLAAEDRATAFKALQSVVQLDPDHAPAWAYLAKLYMSEGQVNRADLALRETRRIKSDDPQVLDLVGTTLTQMGEYDLAKVFFTRANQLRPNYPPFMMNLANNLVYHGDKENSENIFRAVLQI